MCKDELSLKICKDELSHECLRKEEVERDFVHQKYQLDQANERIETLGNQEQYASYLLMLNGCGYCRNLYRGTETTTTED